MQHHDSSPAPRAVLFDRDGTLVVDVPYNGDPSLVVPMPTARETVQGLRDRGVPVGVVSNQSGIARGIVTREQVDAVNREVDRLLGPFDVWCVCPHGPEDDCRCRKPRPGMVQDAAAALGVEPATVAVIGDIGADMGAARAAGARGVLVPTHVTLPEEVRDADLVATDLAGAVALLFAGAASPAAAEDAAAENAAEQDSPEQNNAEQNDAEQNDAEQDGVADRVAERDGVAS